MKYVNSQPLLNTAGVPISALAIANGVTLKSAPIKIESSTGFAVLTAQESHPGASGSLAIAAEYSDDNVSWYTNYTSDMAGSISAEGNIVTSFTNTIRRITHTARLARWMRYSIVASADSILTASYTFQEDGNSI